MYACVCVRVLMSEEEGGERKERQKMGGFLFISAVCCHVLRLFSLLLSTFSLSLSLSCYLPFHLCIFPHFLAFCFFFLVLFLDLLKSLLEVLLNRK